MPLSSLLNTDSSPSGLKGVEGSLTRKCGSEGLGELWKAFPHGVWPSEAHYIKLSHLVIVMGTSRSHHHGLCCTKGSYRVSLLISYRPHRIHSIPSSLSSLEEGKSKPRGSYLSKKVQETFPEARLEESTHF